MVEARQQGISRRIKSVPKGFELGKTWVLCAHRRVFQGSDGVWSAGIFSAFKPSRLEMVVDGSEPDEEIDDLILRGITPVVVEASDELPKLWDGPADSAS